MVSKGRDLTFRQQRRSADGVILGGPLAPPQANVCVASNSPMSAAILLYFRQTADVCRSTKGGKKAALLDGGHAEVKDDRPLRGLPAVAASHFSSAQRQGREWVRTPVTLMSPRLAVRSS